MMKPFEYFLPVINFYKFLLAFSVILMKYGFYSFFLLLNTYKKGRLLFYIKATSCS
jgi:hypothetical protein